MSQWISDITRECVYIRDNWVCTYCGKNLFTCRDDAQLDHVHPRCRSDKHHAERSLHDPRNLVTSCGECNNRKNGKRLHVWLAELAADGKDAAAIGKRIKRRTKRDWKRWRYMARVSVGYRNDKRAEVIAACNAIMHW